MAFVVHISASAADPHVVSLARAFILSMFFVPTLVGVWWLLLFRRAYVAQQFDKPGRGPVSISVIGVYLLASIPFLLLLQTVTPHHVVPGFGRALMGRKFVVYFAFWTAVHLVLGIGLLSWKAWTHMATVLYLLLYIVADSYTLFFRNAATLFSFKDSANVLIGRFALGWGAISIAVALYFLFTRRRAYRAACEARMRAV
ncbi:MAG: hypothetical protein ACRD33_05140 [Candidatus Acidiferrales bacterium]